MKNNPIALMFVAAFVVSSTVACDSVRSPIPPTSFASSNGSSESFLLRGTVMGLSDEGTLPLPGVAVTVSNGTVSHQVVTDMTGAFECGGLSAGDWTVRISYPEGEFEETVTVNGDVNPTFVLEADDLTVLLKVSKSRIAIARKR